MNAEAAECLQKAIAWRLHRRHERAVAAPVEEVDLVRMLGSLYRDDTTRLVHSVLARVALHRSRRVLGLDLRRDVVRREADVK